MVVHLSRDNERILDAQGKLHTPKMRWAPDDNPRIPQLHPHRIDVNGD